MIIDTHTHLFPPEVDKVGTADMLLKEMDAGGVDKSVIVGIAPRVTSDFLAAQARAHPDRLLFYAAINPNDGLAAVDEIDKYVIEYGAKGIKIHPDIQGFQGDDLKLLAPVMEKAVDLKVPILTHSWAWFGSDTRSTPRQIMSLAQAFPEANVIMAHCGGMRFLDLLSVPRVRQHAGKLHNLYLDLSVIVFDCFESPIWPFLEWIIRVIGYDRVLMGSDFPDHSLPETVDRVRKLNITEEQMNLILGENAAKLLNIKE